MLFANRQNQYAKDLQQPDQALFIPLAYVLFQALRQFGLADTDMAKAQCDTIRLKLYKIDAKIRITVRKVWISFADGYPYRKIFDQALTNIAKIPLRM